MNADDLDVLHVIGGLVTCARPLILTEWGIHSCIASTRIGIDVLRYFGVRADPCPVSVVAYNAAAVKQLEETGRVRWDQHDGAWSVGIRPGGLVTQHIANPWDGGHLVIVTREHRLLVDLSIDQVSRPERGLKLEPLTTGPVSEAWLHGTEGLTISNRDEPGIRVQYHAVLSAPPWKHSRDWRGHEGARNRIVGQIVRAIRTRMEETT